MSQPGHDGDAKRGKKRKHKQLKPILEQLPAVTAAAAPAAQQQQQHARQHQQPHPQRRHQRPSQPEQQPADQAQESLGSGNSKFARALGSTDYATREQGLQALSRWLLAKQRVADLDMLKLWKGIFFCFWHSDKEPVQEELAERLAGLVPRCQPDVAATYWAAMLATLRAEWFAMDRHRLNKFLMLVRKFVAALFARLVASSWDLSEIARFTGPGLPLGQALLPLDHKSLGLSHHLADVWLPELGAAVGPQGEGLPPAALAALLAPFAQALQRSGDAPQVARIRESVFKVLAQDLAAAAAAAARNDSDDSKGGSEGEEENEEEEEDGAAAWAYCKQLDAWEYAEHLFELGAVQGVRARNREALYGISMQLEALATGSNSKRRKTGDHAEGAAAAGRGGGIAANGVAVAAAAPAGAGAAQQQRQKQPSSSQQVAAAAAAAAAGVAASGEAKQAAKKQKQKQQQAAAGASPAAAPGPQQNGAATPGSQPKKRKQLVATPQQQQQQQPQQQHHSPGAGTPGSAKQHKKHKGEHQAAGGGSGGGSEARAKGAGAGGGAAAAAATATVLQQDSSSAGKRGVVINLRRNLYHEHGAPPPAADVRTPPRSKPKGSALKSVSKFDASGGGRRGGGRSPGVTPAGGSPQRGGGSAQAQGRRQARVTPSSVPRVKAAAFF